MSLYSWLISFLRANTLTGKEMAVEGLISEHGAQKSAYYLVKAMSS